LISCLVHQNVAQIPLRDIDSNKQKRRTYMII